MRFIPTKAVRVFSKQKLAVSKASPEILFGVGVAAAVTSTVLACRATLKIEGVLEEAQSSVAKVNSVVDHPDYSESDRRRDLTIIHVQTAVSLAKLYAPAAAVGVVSITALTTSHRILTRRNASLAAAYAAVDRGFREYRERVVEKYGEEVDQEMRYGVTEVTVKDEDGKTKKVKQFGGEAPSMYARIFDEYSPSWTRDAEYNRTFLHCQQSYANDLLKSRGHVFLNEVYDMLGLERSRAGQTVGWVLSANSDNYIDFGVFAKRGDVYSARDFVNGREGSILLDFNVDGVILDLIDEFDHLPEFPQKGIR